MKKLAMIMTAFIAVIALSACGEKNYTNIDNAELVEMLANSDDYQFVDVRTSSEYYEEHIPGFHINIDYYLLDNNHSLLDNLDKTKPVVIMCNSGNRSVSAAEIFAEEGFTTIYNLKDGIQGWDGETE